MRTGIALLVLFFSGAASAVPVQWTLKDVILDDGANLTGTFIYDADAPADNLVEDYYYGSFYYAAGYSAFDLRYEGGPGIDLDPERGAFVDYLECTYGCRTTDTGPDILAIRCSVHDCLGGYEILLTLNFSSSLTNAGGEVALLGGDPLLAGDFIANGCSWSCGATHYADIVSGSVVASVVPIPAAVWFFGSALAGMLGYRKISR